MSESVPTTPAATPVTSEPKASSGSDSADFESWLASNEASNASNGESDSSDSDVADSDTIDFSTLDDVGSDESEDVEGETETEDEAEQEIVEDKIVLEIDGEEIEYDASDKEKLARDLAHGLKSDKRYKEAKRLKNQALDLVNKIISNPEEVLTHPSLKEQGFDFREVAEKFLYSELQKERMTEQERRAHDNEIELNKIRAERELQQKTAAQRQAEARQEQIRTSFTEQIITAIENSGLPKTPWSMAKIAEHMKVAIKKGYKDVTAEDVAPLVANDLREMSKQYIASLKDDQLAEALGKDVAEKLRKQNIAKVSNPFAKPQQKNAAQLKNSPAKPNRSSSLYDLLDDVLK